MLCRRQFCQPHVNFCFSIILATMETRMHCFYIPLKLAHTGTGGRTCKEKRNTLVLLKLYLSTEDFGSMPQQKFSSAEKV